MALTDMQVYNDEIQTNTIEMVDQMTSNITSASGGAIALTSIRNRGDYSKEAFWQNLSAARRRVDRYAANDAVANTDLTQAEQVAVKVAGGFGPVAFEPGQLTWLQRNPAEAIEAISRYFAESLVQDQLNTAVMAAVAAVENVAGLVQDDSATAALTQSTLNNSHAKFGDMSGMLITDVMTGAAYHKLIDQALANSTQLFSSTSVTVISILGKNIVVSDIPALYETGTPNKSKVLSLTAGAIEVSGNDDLLTNIDTPNGTERLETTWQADYSFQVGLKGYAWDITNGGPSPLDAELATGTNWDQVTLDKFTAGTLAIGDADL